ncbi:MAG: amidophosphoribosyltransferase [Rickettsiales bacterium]|nr:amidophosphoribosyltransferase [Rickettsiales bacterium]
MCGIVGVFSHRNASYMVANALFSVQHRGQESCGIAVSDGRMIKLHKQNGLVKNVFPQEKLDQFVGGIAIGHVHFPTRGAANENNYQPFLSETLSGPDYSLASNGALVNYAEIRGLLENNGVFLMTANDAELTLKYIVFKVEQENLTIVEAIQCFMKEVKGAYSAVLLTKNELYMFRDPHGFRPLSWGKTDDGTFVVASETCALDIVGAKYESHVKQAEIITVNANGITHILNDPLEYRESQSPKHCIFEHVYFSRPDSYQFNEDVFRVRERIGAKLSESDGDFTPDLVVPIPDTSNFTAFGYANHKKMPVTFGLIRNHYAGRTFIKQSQTVRDVSVQQKYNYLPHTFDGKTVVLIDDSIVRGTTIKKIIDLIHKAGATEVHLRIGSPQVKFPCYYGIDIPHQNDLIANNKSLEQLRKDYGVTTLKHVCIDLLGECVSKPLNYCYACFTGEYFV